jgi:hypothetical protein
MQLHGDITEFGARVGVLVHPRHLDSHRLDVIGANGEPLRSD